MLTIQKILIRFLVHFFNIDTKLHKEQITFACMPHLPVLNHSMITDELYVFQCLYFSIFEMGVLFTSMVPCPRIKRKISKYLLRFLGYIEK